MTIQEPSILSVAPNCGIPHVVPTPYSNVAALTVVVAGTTVVTTSISEAALRNIGAGIAAVLANPAIAPFTTSTVDDRRAVIGTTTSDARAALSVAIQTGAGAAIGATFALDRDSWDPTAYGYGDHGIYNDQPVYHPTLIQDGYAGRVAKAFSNDPILQD